MKARTSLQDGIQVGNKALHLFELKEFGAMVPAFCVIAYNDLLEMLATQDLAYDPEGIKRLVIPETLLQDIRVMIPCRSYAVRSSTALEDGHAQSFAGQFVSRLNVMPGNLAEAIKAVWMSVFSRHVSTYRSNDDSSIPVAVIVQECIEADVSGVVFSCDPVSGNKDLCVVNSLYGLGEGLVSGLLDSDMYVLDDNKMVRESIAEKTEKLVYARDGDLVKVKVDHEFVNKSSMSPATLVYVRDTARALEIYMGGPQDIEFCIKEEKLFLLQSRPVTTLSKNEQATRDYLVWDNSNIIESYPGITLPLTFSFISPVYSAVYRQLSSVLGIDGKSIDGNAYVYDNMLGLLRGRVYYNLYSWYKILSLLPGFGLNAGFMEKMMGVSEKFELKDYKKPNSLLEKFRVLRLVLSLIGNARRLPAMRGAFMANFNRVISEHRALDIKTADAQTCMHAYLRFESTLAKEWKAPLVNDFFAMIYYGLFQKFIEKNLPEAGHDQNNFLVGTGRVITVEPAYLQQEMSKCILADSNATMVFSVETESGIHAWLEENPSHEVSKLFHEYINKWGDRCFAELKLETVTYRQDPEAFIRILKNTFQKNAGFKHSEKQPGPAIKLSFIKNLVFGFLRRRAVDTVTARENLRFERTRAFAEVRNIFMRIGEIFHESGVLEQQRDIFYLGKSEVFDYIKGTSIQLALKSLIALRKKEYEVYFNEPPQAARIKTTDIVYSGSFAAEVNSGEGALSGIPCCPGIVRAGVKIVHSPDDIGDLEGKILVTVSTDPGWVSVFPLVKGILVQRGSVLSHAAIVSREMNIPCIVGIKNIVTQLKNGDVVEMDGSSGVVKIIGYGEGS
jgi:phosphohistidine swiveling domain-containing protein